MVLLAFALVTSGAAFAEEPSKKTYTWDNDPKGVQVFILAGQSNMVGHGKADEGHDNVKGGIGSLRYQVEHDPKNYGHLVNKDGTWKTRDDVKVWWRDSDITAPRASSRAISRSVTRRAGTQAGSARNTASAGPSAIASNSRS